MFCIDKLFLVNWFFFLRISAATFFWSFIFYRSNCCRSRRCCKIGPVWQRNHLVTMPLGFLPINRRNASIVRVKPSKPIMISCLSSSSMINGLQPTANRGNFSTDVSRSISFCFTFKSCHTIFKLLSSPFWLGTLSLSLFLSHTQTHEHSLI